MTDTNEERRHVDPSFLRGMTQPRISRRQLLRYAGVGAGAVSLASILAACAKKETTAGGGGGGGGGGGETALNPEEIFKGEPAGILNFANWPLYMDKTKDAQGNVIHPSLDQFTKQTGIEVNYREVIQDNESFFGKIQPQLQAGQDTGYDLMVITNGSVINKLLQLDYLTPLDPSLRPNWDKYATESTKNPSYDPGNKFTMAYQSGITGIGWNPKLTGREITSFQDLLDPEFKGKVGMFGIVDDLATLAMVGLGIDPEDSTPEDWQKAADVLQKQKDDGIVRQYYNQNYINALSNGDVALTMAWSGDIFQTNLGGDAEGLQFTVPEEGAVIWTDNQCIPMKAQHPVDAAAYMDYAYDPRVAATMEEWINYIAPVQGVKEIIAADAAKASGADRTYLENLTKSPLLFPTPEDEARLHRYRVNTPEEQAQFDTLFNAIIQG